MDHKYKKTEIGIFPKDWKIEPLLKHVELLNGLTYSPENIKKNGLLVLRSSNVQESRIVLEDNVYVNCNVDKNKYLKKDDILICVRNGSSNLIGKNAIANKNYVATFGAFMAVLRGKENRYIFQLLQKGDIQKNIKKNSSATINQITTADFKSIQIPIPLKEEQKEIGDTLATVDNLIDLLRKTIKKKEKIKNQVIIELLSGKNENMKTINLSQIGYTYNGLTGMNSSNFVGGDKKYITFLNVLNNPIVKEEMFGRFHSDKIQNSVKKGDLFFNTSSEIPEEVAMCATIDHDVVNLYLNSFCFGFRITDQSVNNIYLSYYFRSIYGRSIMKTIAQGSTRFNLPKEKFLNYQIKIHADVNKQIEIAETLLNMDKEIEKLNIKLGKYKKIKEGMMEDLLTGKVRLNYE